MTKRKTYLYREAVQLYPQILMEMIVYLTERPRPRRGDPRGRPSQKAPPRFRQIRNFHSTADRKGLPYGTVTATTYDSNYRVTQTGIANTANLLYTYSSGNLSSVQRTNSANASQTYSFPYDSIGRLISSEQKEGTSTTLRTNQNYNEYNQLTKQGWQMGSTAYSETYTYNASDGSLNTMTTGVGNTLTMGYDGLRRLSTVTGGPFNRSYTYRDISSTATTMQVSQLSYPNLGSGVSFGYTYDNLGNIATYTAPDGKVITYTYDNQGQLLSAAGDTTYTYTYDTVGNILTANGHTYTYGNANWKDLLTAFDGETITYDNSGNPISYYNGTRWAFTWNNGRSLTRAVSTTTAVDYTYDLSGLRTSKTVGDVIHNYLYAGSKLMRETYGSNTLDFFYDANGTPYALKYNGTVYYHVTNLQGDVIRIVDASGNTVASYEYDPYGKVISATGTLAEINPIRYRGYYYDTETGFYYLNNRYYDPAVGRFISADVYVSTGQNIIGHNMFAYCANNPVLNTDQTGSEPITIFLLIGVAVVAVVTIVTLDLLNKLAQKAAPALNAVVNDAKVAFAHTSKECRAYAKTVKETIAQNRKNSEPRIHHIVPTGSFSNRGETVSQNVAEMQRILIDAKIDPETDPINQMIVSQGFHATLHTNMYLNSLHKSLKRVDGNETEVRLVLYWYRIMIAASDPGAMGY